MGDVLNTTARLQGLCKKYEADLLVSEDLKDRLPSAFFHYGETGLLQGKRNLLTIYVPEDPTVS